MTPDEVILRNARSGKDITTIWDAMARPLTPEEQAAFDRQPPPLPRLPDPCPFLSVATPRTGRKGVEITVGMKGTF